jgi:hypothetical protein
MPSINAAVRSQALTHPSAFEDNMKKYAGFLLLLAGCSNAPTAPAATETIPLKTMEIPAPIHHNIPATMPTGEVVWVCETLPRTYLRCEADGITCQRTTERDHYIQSTRCPEVPIS